MPTSELSAGSVALRFLAALVLILASFNPEGASYFHWALLDWQSFDPIKGFVGILLLIGWSIFLRATSRSLGVFGFMLATGFFAMLVWALVYYDFIAADSPRVITYLGIFVLAGVLTAGMVWSIIRRRLTGQVDVDQTDGLP